MMVVTAVDRFLFPMSLPFHRELYSGNSSNTLLEMISVTKKQTIETAVDLISLVSDFAPIFSEGVFLGWVWSCTHICKSCFPCPADGEFF